MNDGFSWWLVVLGIAIGIGLVWLFTVRLPVGEADIDAEETVEEASWISETIESWGGVAPAPLVQEVLELHRRYLNGDRSVPGADEAEPAEGPADAPAAEAAVVTTAPDASGAVSSTGGSDLAPGDARSAQLPAAGMSPATYVPPAYPPAGGFAEIPPPPSPRAEPE